MNSLLIPGIIVGAVLLVGIGGYNYKNILDYVNPDFEHRIGDKYFGGRKTMRKKDRKHSKSRRKIN